MFFISIDIDVLFVTWTELVAELSVRHNLTWAFLWWLSPFVGPQNSYTILCLSVVHRRLARSPTAPPLSSGLWPPPFWRNGGDLVLASHHYWCDAQKLSSYLRCKTRCRCPTPAPRRSSIPASRAHPSPTKPSVTLQASHSQAVAVHPTPFLVTNQARPFQKTRLAPSVTVLVRTRAVSVVELTFLTRISSLFALFVDSVIVRTIRRQVRQVNS